MADADLRRALVIGNPVAGRGRGAEAARELAQHLERAGAAVELFLSRGRDDARARAARLEPGVDLVASVGGDGTLAEVLSGLPRRDVPIAVLPMGTGNVLGLDLELPRDPAALAAAIRAGRTQSLDTARVGRRLSFLATSAGFDADVVRELEGVRQGPITKRQWAHAGWRAWRRWRPARLVVTVDGERVPGEHGMVVVANLIHYGGWRSLSGDRALDDGRFEVYLLPARSRLDLLRHGLRALLATLPGGGVQRVQGSVVRVSSDEPIPYQVDGDLAGVTPFDLAVEAERFRIVVP